MVRPYTKSVTHIIVCFSIALHFWGCGKKAGLSAPVPNPDPEIPTAELHQQTRDAKNMRLGADSPVQGVGTAATHPVCKLRVGAHRYTMMWEHEADHYNVGPLECNGKPHPSPTTADFTATNLMMLTVLQAPVGSVEECGKFESYVQSSSFFSHIQTFTDKICALVDGTAAAAAAGDRCHIASSAMGIEGDLISASTGSPRWVPVDPAAGLLCTRKDGRVGSMIEEHAMDGLVKMIKMGDGLMRPPSLRRTLEYEKVVVPCEMMKDLETAISAIFPSELQSISKIVCDQVTNANFPALTKDQIMFQLKKAGFKGKIDQSAFVEAPRGISKEQQAMLDSRALPAFYTFLNVFMDPTIWSSFSEHLAA